MATANEPKSFGVFKPVGHVVISFPDADGAAAAAQELGEGGVVQAADVQRLSDREMLDQIDREMATASPLAEVGQELNLIRSHRVLAERGYHWLVVRAKGDEARQVAELAGRHGAERAQSYGTFLIEELIERPHDVQQVSESPARGLDAQTPSGLEAEAGEPRRRSSSRQR